MSAFHCHFCGGNVAWTMADLGIQPLANNYLRGPSDIPLERSYPLLARVCSNCLLAQVDKVVEATEIFSHYSYFSSCSSSWVEHAGRYADAMRSRFGIGPQSLVIEVASNDGYMLKHFLAAGVPVLGIEPAANIAQAAVAQGIRTVNVFLSLATARQIVTDGHKADLVAANNVLAHVPDINDFISGLRELLKPTGVLTVEFHHLLHLVSKQQFDTIYHEHFSYLSLAVVQRMFAAHGLRVFDVEEISTHGGSLRVYASPAGGSDRPLSPSVDIVLEKERLLGLHREACYRDLGESARRTRNDLLAFLSEAREQGKRVVAYGAAAKGNTLLNYCRVTSQDIAYVADKNPLKQGHLLPGSHIDICSPSRLRETKPDYVLILPWNLAREITAEHAYVRDWGGRFVVAIPSLAVLP